MTEIPHIRKLGRYLFYFPCALGFGFLTAFTGHIIGLPEEFSKQLIFPLFLVAFLSLRDLEKNAELRGSQRRAGEPQ